MSSLPSSDPFGTEALRASVRRAWADSPTRLTEDTNAERDLRVGAYRDRLFVELAQNAADAAKITGAPGTLRISIVDSELRVANTGAPLDARGVASLSSLRASGKEGMVGQFGVGFAAVLAVSSEPRVISRTGGVAFSEARTRELVSQSEVPVLRLPWAADEDVPEGFDTEVRLPLREGVDGAELLDRVSAEVEDLLLALPWLNRIEIGGAAWQRSTVDSMVEIAAPDDTVRRWLTQETTDGLWAVPVDGGPVPLESDVLHAPTPTDERLSLPARLIASVPMEPSRRRVLPGTELAGLAQAYPALVRKLAPEHRPLMVPKPGFPMSDVDSELREAVQRQLASQTWLPGQKELPASGARVLTVESPELVELLGDIVPRLVSLSGFEVARVLATVGADPLEVVELVEILTGLERPPAWWRSLYDALLPLLEAHTVSDDDLGALPVPLADGRILPGPRGTFLFGASAEVLELIDDADVVGLRLVHPDAAHPLLELLGAKRADSADLLESPALRDAIDRSLDDARSGLDVRPLADAVLRLVSDTPVDGLGALALPSADGWRRADELMLPGSPLRAIFDPEAVGEDGPLSVLDNDFAQDWSTEALTNLGVLDGFVVTEDGIRDLDLVADDAWPEALRLLAGERETWHALSGSAGEWIARNALLAGRAPEEWRLPEADTLAGLYDPVPDVGLKPDLLVLAGVRTELAVTDLDDALDVLDRLGDASRTLAPGLISRAYAALVAAELDWSSVDAPERVRAVDGSVVDAEQAAVLDRPWLAAVWPTARLVAVPAGAEHLAELLDVPLLSELVSASLPEGEFMEWSELTAVRLAAEMLDIPFPEGGVVVHEELTVEIDGVKRAAPWWVKSAEFHGEHHAEDSPAGLARAFAWASGRWADRHLIATLLEDPDPLTLLA
ncbi:sacsin N-terminal ATP-binding-like domain-containing protein [Amycolatopsis sp. GM8]|uniref:sacsin N-terminal ATP-binding-like domain-containing protein n=1 Tax=Amycolatopsis sp. GM8 TaxID=2896530 RepID=UPI001F3C6A61|nr:molecular chaperone Hsp90 [Amycolatopsis sp. GM8]